MPAGRPSEYTPELAQEICRRIADGETTRKVMKEVGLALSVLFRWLKQYPEFEEQYARAKEIAMESMADEILEIADDSAQDIEEYEIAEGIPAQRTNHEVINRSRLRVDTRKWLMSKLAPKKYGDKQNIEHSGSVEQISTVNVIGKDRG